MRREELSKAVWDARRRTLALVEDLSNEQLFGPRLSIVNPLLWEIGHVAWFQERWALREALGHRPLLENGDQLYDSSAIPHDVRWDLPLPTREQTLRYLFEIRDRVREQLRGESYSNGSEYYVRLVIAHEDMHDEAFILTRQTIGYPAPNLSVPNGQPARARIEAQDAEVPGGAFSLGAAADAEPFIHDNEKWAHPVEVKPFRIAKLPVTQGEFARFVDEGGYQERGFWSEEGWRWRLAANAEQPVYWRTTKNRWERRHFDTWVQLEPNRPMVHVNWHEADAYCRFSRRRLPTELEWEVAAAAIPDGRGGLSPAKRRYPWGDAPPAPDQANLDGRHCGCVEVTALPAGDSAFGCRQMIGNVWEWTQSPFLPYPGFSADPYKDYSQPWFGTHKVLRGGCWATRSRLIRNTWRNFYTPERRDILVGFRTCAP
jgi:gamma-glutamyl hercynylcysteine S-oxide synthase